MLPSNQTINENIIYLYEDDEGNSAHHNEEDKVLRAFPWWRGEATDLSFWKTSLTELPVSGKAFSCYVTFEPLASDNSITPFHGDFNPVHIPDWSRVNMFNPDWNSDSTTHVVFQSGLESPCKQGSLLTFDPIAIFSLNFWVLLLGLNFEPSIIYL